MYAGIIKESWAASWLCLNWLSYFGRSKRAGRDRISRQIHRLVERQQDRHIKIWLLVCLGGQRMTDVAKFYGYRYGSGVHQAIKRLEEGARKDHSLADHLRSLKQNCGF